MNTECEHKRVLALSAKCSDLCAISYNGKAKYGYVPRNLNIGGGDYIEFRLCLDCGQIFGVFPVTEEEVWQVFGEQ